MTVSIIGALSVPELSRKGFASIGADVCIDPSVTIIGPSQIEIGSHVRIDAHVHLAASSQGLIIGNHVHISAYVMIVGLGRVELKDFSGVSSRVSIFSSNDDYLGFALTGPTVPRALRRLHSAPVIIGRHAVIGAGSVILPGVTIGDGACVGALSLVKRDVGTMDIVGGNPLRFIRKRRDDFLALEKDVH